MPLGKNRTDVNNGGVNYRKGTPITLPHTFGNVVTTGTAPPAGNVRPSSGTEKNSVTWAASPAHFGNNVNLASGN